MYKTDLFTHTQQYAEGWRHLEREEFTGTVKVLGATYQSEGESYDDGGFTRFRVVAPSTLKRQDLTRAIAQTLGGHPPVQSQSGRTGFDAGARVRRFRASGGARRPSAEVAQTAFDAHVTAE